MTSVPCLIVFLFICLLRCWFVGLLVDLLVVALLLCWLVVLLVCWFVGCLLVGCLTQQSKARGRRGRRQLDISAAPLPKQGVAERVRQVSVSARTLRVSPHTSHWPWPFRPRACIFCFWFQNSPESEPCCLILAYVGLSWLHVGPSWRHVGSS